jgi:hypothetical protein
MAASWFLTWAQTVDFCVLILTTSSAFDLMSLSIVSISLHGSQTIAVEPRVDRLQLPGRVRRQTPVGIDRPASRPKRPAGIGERRDAVPSERHRQQATGNRFRWRAVRDEQDGADRAGQIRRAADTLAPLTRDLLPATKLLVARAAASVRRQRVLRKWS